MDTESVMSFCWSPSLGNHHTVRLRLDLQIRSGREMEMTLSHKLSLENTKKISTFNTQSYSSLDCPLLSYKEGYFFGCVCVMDFIMTW